jgi:hypothetical protein
MAATRQGFRGGSMNWGAILGLVFCFAVWGAFFWLIFGLIL